VFKRRKNHERFKNILRKLTKFSLSSIRELNAARIEIGVRVSGGSPTSEAYVGGGLHSPDYPNNNFSDLSAGRQAVHFSRAFAYFLR
jgi:hypothetical protein